MTYSTKKKLQSLFKKLGYWLFKLVYGEIKDYKPINNYSDTLIKKSQIKSNLEYNVYTVNSARIYTDTINDSAIIKDNFVIKEPSFQIRDTKFEKIEKNIVFSKGTPRIKKTVKGTLFSLLTGGAGNNNYWHWLFDVLPRIKIFKNVYNIEEVDYFLFPNLDKKFQLETIQLLGIPIKKCFSSLKYRHLQCDKIINTDHPYVIKNDATSEIQNLPTWIITWLKEVFTKNLNLDDNSFPSNFYIDRSDASPNINKMRKIINEEEVISFVKSKKYRVIRLSDFSFKDQIKLFHNAEKIIGLHGAGFANVIFSKSNLRMLELKPSGAAKMCENLAKKCNVIYDCISILPEKYNENNQMGHIRINMKDLENRI